MALTLQQLSQLRGAASDLIGLEGESVQDFAKAQGAQLAAAGDTEEAKAYGTSEEIAAENARQEEIAGRVTQYQQEREAMRTLGSQRADIAGAGFKASGSALFLARDSLRNFYTQQQLTGVQTELTAGGYREQGQAAVAEMTAAQTATAAANALAAQEAAAGQSAKTQATNFAAQLAAIPGGEGQAALDVAAGKTSTPAIAGLSGDSGVFNIGQYNPSSPRAIGQPGSTNTATQSPATTADVTAVASGNAPAATATPAPAPAGFTISTIRPI